jgi:protein-tyrosine kinase
MEQIKQAVERAKAGVTGERLQPVTTPAGIRGGMHPPDARTQAPETGSGKRYNTVVLHSSELERHRIVAHDAADPRSKAFDMLRTQVLQAMDQKNWQFLAITSPTEGCGKTVTAINLALSIARQPERSALLIDMDLQRPAVANYLGIKCRNGVQGILEGRTTLADAMVRAQADNCELMVLPAEAPTVHSSELISSRNMHTMLRDIKQTFRSQTVIFDMPPLLQGDEVLATLPKIDCALLVTAIGVSTLHEIKECNRHLQGTEVIRMVLNKSSATVKRHYY